MKCLCPRMPEHEATTDLEVYGQDGQPIRSLSMMVCDDVVDGYAAGIRAGLIRASIRATLVRDGFRFPTVVFP